MASRKKSDDSSRSASKNSKRHVGVTAFLSSSSSSEDEDVTTGCRSCRNTTKEYATKTRDEPDSQPEQETSRARTEENSLSFKHFLKNGSQTNFQNSGARPKIYFPPAQPNAYPVEKGPGPYNLEKVYSRNPTELPDFVQDHLVIEQYYLNPERKQQATDSDTDNLPDFALNSVRKTRITKKPKEKVTGYCDLASDGNWDKYALPRQNQSVPNTSSCNTHFFAEPSVGSSERPESSGFPLDLPISANESNPDANAALRDCSHPGTSEANVPKSLPDFLNDGPIRNRAADSENVQDISESTVQRILLENEILRHGLQIAHNQIDEKKERIRLLEAELASRKEMEHEETVHLEKAMEQVEDNLKHNARRVVNAESTILSLKKEIKSLTVEISLLRLENDHLRASAATNGRNDRGSSNVDQTARRLADDLRNAASTAEVSLRQLLAGVDNLRVLASAVENVDRIEDRTKDFLPDFDPDNAAGPAP